MLCRALVITTLFALTSTLVGACGDSDSDNPDVDTILALSGDATAGETVYTAQCSSCHLADGSGGSGPRLSGYSGDDADIITIVLEGEGAMPGFRSQLSDQQVANVVAYVRTL